MWLILWQQAWIEHQHMSNLCVNCLHVYRSGDSGPPFLLIQYLPNPSSDTSTDTSTWLRCSRVSWIQRDLIVIQIRNNGHGVWLNILYERWISWHGRRAVEWYISNRYGCPLEVGSDSLSHLVYMGYIWGERGEYMGGLRIKISYDHKSDFSFWSSVQNNLSSNFRTQIFCSWNLFSIFWSFYILRPRKKNRW